MSFLTIVLLAIGLSFDTFAVSISCGIARRQMIFGEAFRIAIVLAFFQATMPLIGWLFGLSIRSVIEPIDHWIALILLSIVGIKMIVEAFSNDTEESSINPMDIKFILTIALATSIDALAVGVSFSLVTINLLHAYLTIGFITFMVAMLGMLFGKNIGSLLGRRMEIIGGIILIGIGIKIVIEHTA